VKSIYKSEDGKRAIVASYRAALRRWPVPNHCLTVPTRHGDTFVVVSGEDHAAPVVLFHGSGSNASMWMQDVAAWAREFRVYAVDMIGEPGLSAASRPPLRSEAYVEWLDDVWNALGLEAAAVVGVSLGGWLALEYAAKRPQRVASLSLLSPSGVGAQNRAFLLKAGVLLMFGEWGRRRALRLATGRATLPREVTEPLMLRFRYFRPRMEPLPIRSDADLSGLTMPVQLIVGGRDVMLRSEETRDRITRHVPNAQVSFLEGEGHIVRNQAGSIASFVREAFARA
jgi:pimeloyl-ACP methyl ester carboxylesterase